MQAAKRAAPAGGRSPRSASLFSLSKRRSKAVNALQQLGLLHIWALHTWRRLAAPRTALTAPFLAVPSTLDSRSQLSSGGYYYYSNENWPNFLWFHHPATQFFKNVDIEDLVQKRLAQIYYWAFWLRVFFLYTHKSFKMTMTQEVECAACFRPIRDRFLLKVLDKPWHPACVRCELCRKLLDEKCFYKEGKMYCKDDFYR